MKKPSSRLRIYLVRKKGKRSIVVPIMAYRSMLLKAIAESGEIKLEIPGITVMLRIVAPIRQAATNSKSLFFTAIMLVARAGIFAHIANNVNAMTVSPECKV